MDSRIMTIVVKIDSPSLSNNVIGMTLDAK